MSKRVTIDFDTESLARDFAQSVRASGEVILEAGDCGIEVVCAAEVVDDEEDDDGEASDA